MRRREPHLREGTVIFISIILAYLLMQTNLLEQTLLATRGLGWLESFFAGVFFTSMFTTAPAMVALGEISQVNPPLQTAFFGALGAVLGDLLIFRFVRDRLSTRIAEFMSTTRFLRKVQRESTRPFFRWVAFFLGGFVIASPLPDELGVTLLGLSKTNTGLFMMIAFSFNFFGILMIALVARSLA